MSLTWRTANCGMTTPLPTKRLSARTSSEHAPWYVVPANRKWYRDLVVASILIKNLEEMDPQFPPEPDLDGVVVE